MQISSLGSISATSTSRQYLISNYKYNFYFSFQIPGVVEEEAVRIFLQFERMEAAIKGILMLFLYFLCSNSLLSAVVDLNGRFFGGRAVKAGFYNVDKFRQLDLAEAID